MHLYFDIGCLVPSFNIIITVDTAGDSIGVFVEYILAPVLAVLILLVLLALVVVFSLYLVLQLRMRYPKTSYAHCHWTCYHDIAFVLNRKYSRNWQIYGSPELVSE